MTKDPRVKVTQTKMGASAGLLYISPEIAGAETTRDAPCLQITLIERPRNDRIQSWDIARQDCLPATTRKILAIMHAPETSAMFGLTNKALGRRHKVRDNSSFPMHSKKMGAHSFLGIKKP